MSDLALKTIDYFRASENYFWRWADNGEVLEFSNGKTIGYRDDIMFIMDSLEYPGEVPFGTIVLLQGICNNSYPDLQKLLLQQLQLSWSQEGVRKMGSSVLSFLKIVDSLPAEYRIGLKRVALFQAILEKPMAMTLGDLKAMSAEFKSGQLDEKIFENLKEIREGRLESDLLPFVRAFSQFPDRETLELKLRTGLTKLPEKADLPVPEPQPEAGDLLEQLSADVKTVGLSRLAKKIMAALNIPMHLSGSSDQSVGGVSDISNRGHYDKLLLSELAQDDLLLTARLANNEALFLQREQLPADANHQWHVMLDTTLKMWGLPRVFGLAAALAFSESKKQDTLRAWALGGSQATAVDLATKPGVIDILEKLDPALNCGRQLHKIVNDPKILKGKFILITSSHYREDAGFYADFLEIKDRLDYLVVVNRDGYIELIETRGNKHKIVNHAAIDLDETLFAKRKLPQKQYQKAGLPAMLALPQYPLLFPASKIRVKNNNTGRQKDDHAAVITQDQRLLYWHDKEHGAIELVDHIDTGEYCWGDSDGYLFVLVRRSTKPFIKVYQADITRQHYTVHDCGALAATDARFNAGLFLVKLGEDILSIDPQTGAVVQAKTPVHIYNQVPSITHFQLLGQIKKTINNGYSTINSARMVYVHTAGRLFIDQRELRPDPKGKELWLKDRKLAAVEWITPTKTENMAVDYLPNINFTKFIWKDGSEAVLDSRGLLHLKSADSSIPEISIVLVIEKSIAAWSADGKVCGAAYFTGDDPTNAMLVADFYDNYIQRFIDALK
jgi:hypothetical protein